MRSRGASDFIETHSPGLQWVQGAKWKETLLRMIAAVPGSPTAPQDAIIEQLRVQVRQLEATVAGLTDQVNKLTADKATLAGQVQTLQAQNAALLLQVKSLADANTGLKTQLGASEADRQALQKKVADLEARIAELTQKPLPPRRRSATSSPPCPSTQPIGTTHAP